MKITIKDEPSSEGGGGGCLGPKPWVKFINYACLTNNCRLWRSDNSLCEQTAASLSRRSLLKASLLFVCWPFCAFEDALRIQSDFDFELTVIEWRCLRI